MLEEIKNIEELEELNGGELFSTITIGGTILVGGAVVGLVTTYVVSKL